MSKKSTKAKQEAAKKYRLQAGGQAIAQAAQREIERRQQKAFQQTANNAGISKQVSKDDFIARAAVKEIQKRKAFSNKLIEEEEQQKKAEKKWQEIAKSAFLNAYGPEKKYIGTINNRKEENTIGSIGNANKLPNYPQEGTLTDKLVGGPDYLKDGKRTGEMVRLPLIVQPGQKSNRTERLPDYLPPVTTGLTEQTTRDPAGGKYGPYASDQQVVNNWLNYLNGKKPQDNTPAPRASDEQMVNNFLNQQLQRRAAIENQTPIQQYAALKPEEQSRWMRPQSNAVQEILSFKNAKDYVNRHWNDPYKDLETDRAEAENSKAASEAYLQNATMTQEEAWDAIQSPIIKNQLMRTLPKNLLERPEDYDENPEYYNEMLYDTYRGKGAYQRVMMTGNQNDKQQMKDDLAELWAEVDSGRLRTAYDVENGLWQNENRYEIEQANANYQTKKLKGIAAKEKQRDEYNALIGQYGEPERPDFVPEYDRGGQAYGSMKELESGVHTDDVHRIYSFLGGGKEYQAFAAGTNPRVSTEYSYAMMMTDGSNGSNNEIGIFMDLYNQAMAEGREPKEASAFLKGLQPALQSRYNDEFEKIQIAEASKIAPVSASIGSLMMKQANTYLDIPRHVANWLGDESTEDYNSWWYAPARQSEQIEENIANNIGGFGGKIYKNVMNSLSNMTRALTTPGSGKVAKSIMSLGGFFMQVDQEATARYLKNNDYDTAQKLGALDAAFEVCEEFLPFETMLGSVGKNMGLAILQNALSEAGQEFVGATVFEKLKGIITGEDSEDERIAEILHDGFYIDKNGNKVTLDKDEGVRLQQARVQAGKEFWDQAVENGLAGAFGGGLGGMYGTIGTGIGIEEYGKQIKNEKNEVKGKSGAWRLAELGAKMGEKSKARQTAEWIQADILAGKNPSNFRLGKLAMQIVEETEGKSESVINQTVHQTVKEQLVRGGVEESEAGQFADIIARNLTKTKGRMAKEDIETLSKSQAAIDLWKSYYTADRKNLQEIRTNIKEATKEQRQTMASIEDLTRTTAYATSSVADAVESSLQATRTDEEAIDHLAKNRGDILSEEYAAKAKEILEKDADAKKSKSFVDDVMKIRMAVYTMKEEMPETNLSEDAVNQLRKAAQEEFDAEDELRFQNQQTIRPGEGKADFDGVDYGTEEWKKAVKDKGLSNKQIRRLQVQAEIGKRMGFTTHVFYDNSQAGLKKQGYEIAQTGEIYINAATDMRHHMLVTMSHEMTHWLEQNNREAYNELRKFVVKGLQDRGIDVEKQLLRAIDNQRYAQIMEREQNGGKSSISDLTLMGAMQELVAKSCENLLSSQAFEQELKEKNPTLHGKIKEYIQSFVANLRKAVEGMDESLSREAYAMLDQTEEIAKIWLKGYNQALGNENTNEAPAAAEGQAQLSVEEIPERKQTINIEDAITNPDKYNDYFEYDNLIKKDPIALVNLSTKDENKSKDKLIEDGIQNAKAVGVTKNGMTYIKVNDIGGEVIVTKSTIDHTPNRFSNEQAPILEHIGELIQQSILYNTADGRENNQKGTYMLLAAGYNNKNQIVYASFTVNKTTHKLVDYDFVHSVKHRNTTKEVDVSMTGALDGDATRFQTTSNTISIAEAFEDVKEGFANTLPISVLNRLNTQRRQTKDTPLLHHSIADMDNEYMDAVKNEDMETAERLVDQAADLSMPNTKVRSKDGKLMKMYHGTKAEFNKFRRDMIGSTGRFEGSGFNFTPYEGRAKSYGGNVLTGYLNIQKPLSAEKKTISVSKLADLIRKADPTGDYIISDYARETRDYGKASFVQRESLTAARSIWDASENDVDIYSYISAADSDAESLIKVFSDLGYDGLIHYDDEGNIKTAVAFSSNQFKKADPVTYDDNGNVIPLSERFNDEKEDIRYSVEAGEDPVDVPNSQGDAMFTILPGNTIAATEYSLSSYYDLKERTKMINALKKAGYDEQQINDWIEDLDSIAAKIATDRLRYDFVADRRKKFLKPNGDVYKKTIDASTMCKKTRLYNGTFNVVQHLLPNTALLPEDLIKLYNIMKDMGLETPCKFCYVQSRRRHLGTYAEDWLKRYKGEYVPRIEEVTTSDGLAKLKKEHPKTASDFVRAMNRKGVNNPKLVQERTDYRGEIRRMKEDTIKYLNEIGGLRIQSFSDFEVVHMLDMMQVVMDMKAKKLAGQAYTKIPEFAWVFGKTGIKINLSLVGRGSGLNAKGELVFDNEEGIDSDEAMALRKAYSKNVGTVLVGINDKHIIAAMGDDRIDFIIPFHKSGWSENELKNMRGLEYYDDYTDSQNEYDLTWENGKMVKTKAENNIDPLSYWEFEHDGEYNARKYLQLCKDQHIQPKFSQFLTDNGDGSWSLPEGNDRDSMNIRKGYWKTLIDFKMYDNEGNGAKQEIVHPDFNMDAANRILDEYDGSHQTLPESWEAANAFVDWYKAEHPLDNVRTQYSVEDAPDMDVERFMLGLNELHMNSVQEKAMHRQFRELKGDIDAIEFKISERQRMIDKIMRKKEISVYDREQLRKIENLQNYDRERLAQKKKEYIRVTTRGGYAELMKKNAQLMEDVVTGRTAEELNSTVEAMNRQMDDVTREMEARRKTIEALAESEGVLAVRTQFNRAGLKRIAAKLKSDLQSDLSLGEIENRLALIALKMKEGKYDKETTEELAGMITGKMRSNYDGYVISQLRGKTITLGPVQLKELRGQDRTLAEIRKELAGTGIMISSKGNVTLDEEWEELCDLFPSLDRTTSPGGQLDALMSIIKNEMRMSQSQYMNDDGLMQVTQTVLEAARDLMPEIVTDAKSLKLIRDTLEYVHDVAATARGTAQGLADVENLMKNLQRTGKQAGQQAIHIGNNMLDVISYYNALGEQSEAALWKRERAALIAQLKSENTQNLLEEQAKWKEKIAKDRAAKGMQEGNMQIRKRITTNYSRLRKLLIAETDQKNVPEHMKGLAREMLRMLTENDLAGRKITGMARKDLTETLRVLDIMDQQDGRFTEDDLKLINDEEAQAAVLDALADLEDGIKFYNASTRGYDIMTNLQAFKNALGRVDDAVTTICNVIGAERTISLKDRLIPIADAAADIRKGMERSRHKGEWTGRGSKAMKAVKSSVVYGNTTPEYFIKNLRNAGMEEQWDEARRGENRYGLEVQKAQDYLKALAEKTNYKAWENEKKEVTMGGRKRTISVQNIMEIYAIWQREKTTNPEMSQHLNKGGVYIQEDENQEGRLHRERQYLQATRLSDDEVLDMYNLLTQDQKDYMNGVVKYLSNDMSDLGNEASMRMYGIKKYKESYYFPMKVWDGVKSARSDKGITGTTENRAANKSWSKRRQHMASNALVIGNFTQDAVNHIVEMINYNTMAPAIENMNKVLNFQFTEGEDMDSTTKRNMRVLFQEAYGKEALNYLETLMADMNGGLVQDQRKTLRDKALSTFKKISVAGSLSVALQQPLSYIRAAMMIKAKYLAQGLSPRYWKGSAAEMNKYSGVAVIKDMGKFDMNFGSSAKEYITPEGKSNAYEKVSDLVTMAPALMDKMTWTRMWSAVKMEQHALHKDMDMKSDEFLQIVAERFNEVMRKTQVYDSILVKSSNMRSQKWELKLITSFMAEPTLSLNVLADAARNVREKGGMTMLARAGATFALSAVCQAIVKGLMGSGRTPDKKKTWLENFLNKWQYYLMSELNPFSLIPGYSDMIELLKTGKLQDDAMGAIGKIFSVFDAAQKAAQGQGESVWRDIEDTAGQLAQLFTNIPAKNIMRDMRAMYNWFASDTYAARETSEAVLKYQREANWFSGDNLLGAINARLGDAGFKSNAKEYYGRMYDAMKNGNQEEADQIREYLMLGKGVKAESIDSGVKAAAKADDSMTDAEKTAWMIDAGMTNELSDVTKQYRDGKLTKAEAKKLMKQMDPQISENDLFWELDRVDFQKETGADKKPTGYGYRLIAAVNANDTEKIRSAVKELLAHGLTKEKLKKEYFGDWKSEYLAADTAGKRKIINAITTAYKAAGYTAEDAQKAIDSWNKEKKKKEGKPSSSGGRIASAGGMRFSGKQGMDLMEKNMYANTEGKLYGKGNIDLNHRKTVRNDDGSISTELSMSFYDEDTGKEVLIPTVVNGRIVSEDEAIDHYYETGEYLGRFNTPEEADAYAEMLHNRQDWYYNEYKNR